MEYSSSRENMFLGQSRNSPDFMETEDSPLYSQQSTV